MGKHADLNYVKLHALLAAKNLRLAQLASDSEVSRLLAPLIDEAENLAQRIAAMNEQFGMNIRPEEMPGQQES